MTEPVTCGSCGRLVREKPGDLVRGVLKPPRCWSCYRRARSGTLKKDPLNQLQEVRFRLTRLQVLKLRRAAKVLNRAWKHLESDSIETLLASVVKMTLDDALEEDPTVFDDLPRHRDR